MLPLHLGGASSSLLLAYDPDSSLLPVVLHWGTPLQPDDLLPEHFSTSVAACAGGVPHSAPDLPLATEVLPQAAHDHPGRWVLRGYRAGGGAPDHHARARFERTSEPVLHSDTHGTQCLEILGHDVNLGLALRTEIEHHSSGVFRVRHQLTNEGSDPFVVHSLVASLPLPARATQAFDLTGRWALERQEQRVDLGTGTWLRESSGGRPGHDSSTLLVAGAPGFGYRSGEVFGVHLAWSGDSTYGIERRSEGPCSIAAGESLTAGEVILQPGDTYQPPWLMAVYSRAGLDGLSAQLHAWARARPQHPHTVRKVVVNTWEAVYFDHDLPTLTTLAALASKVGAERFVLDDGWFGSRRSSRSGLGDWAVADAVWPEGLEPLIEQVHARGLDFGLWVEPEMINLDSELARAHPEWVLRSGSFLAGSWRDQHVLDLTSEGAWNHIFERLDSLLSEYDIAYLKWDHNRDLIDSGKVHGQTLAVYRLLAELKRAHPDVEIESCASGGARIDYGILQHTDRVWTSDGTDPIDRQVVQRGTGLLIPPELMGAHVSAPRNHQTGRRTELSMRAGTAFFGHFGIEWDLAAATGPELEELTQWVRLYKDNREWMHAATTMRLDEDDSRMVQGLIAADRSQAFVSIAALASTARARPSAIHISGLMPHARYAVRAVTPGQGPHTVEVAGPQWLPDTEVSGHWLEHVGLASPHLGPGQLLLLHLRLATGH